MTYADKVAWLRRYRQAVTNERRLRECIHTTRARAEATTQAMNGMPHGGSGGDKLQSSIELIAEYQLRLATQIAKSEQLRADIEAAVKRLPTMQRNVLLARYIDGLHWWQVANRLYISERWAKAEGQRGVEHLEIVHSTSLSAE